MKNFNLKSFLNKKRLFIKNAIAEQKEKMNSIVNPTPASGNDAVENNSRGNIYERPYYERFISNHHNDFLDYSGGIMGI